MSNIVCKRNIRAGSLVRKREEKNMLCGPDTIINPLNHPNKRKRPSITLKEETVPFETAYNEKESDEDICKHQGQSEAKTKWLEYRKHISPLEQFPQARISVSKM